MEKLKEGVVNSKKRNDEDPDDKRSPQSGELDNTSEKSGTGDVKNSVVSKTSNNKSVDGPAPAGPSAASADGKSNNSPKVKRDGDTKDKNDTPSTNRDASPGGKSPGRPE
jgi:hypothetical protein